MVRSVRPATAVALLVAAFGLAGCAGEDPAVRARARPEISLPADALTPLVPAPDEVPTGMVPLLTGSGQRDAAAVAAYSADPVAAAASLSAHGFESAYVAQYADPNGAQVLSVVVARFADVAGATADLEGDLAGSSGEVLKVATVGEVSQTRRQALPGASDGELVTLRFRQGRTTWLLAYGNQPRADAQVAAALGRMLVERASATT